MNTEPKKMFRMDFSELDKALQRETENKNIAYKLDNFLESLGESDEEIQSLIRKELEIFKFWSVSKNNVIEL